MLLKSPYNKARYAMKKLVFYIINVIGKIRKMRVSETLPKQFIQVICLFPTVLNHAHVFKLGQTTGEKGSIPTVSNIVYLTIREG